MKPPLRDTIWLQRGVSAIWDPKALHRIGLTPKGALSVREFLCLYDGGWNSTDERLTQSGPLVVAGLEATLDTLSPEAADEWMRATFYSAVRSFQNDFAGGGGEAALIVWIANGQRVQHQVASNRYGWLCEPPYIGQQLPFGALLWNGAQDDVRQIMFADPNHPAVYAGLFCGRIS